MSTGGKTGSSKAVSMSWRSVLLIVLDRKDIVAAAFDDFRSDRFLAEDCVPGDDLAPQVEPLQELQRIGNFQTLAARGLVSENRLQAAAERREHMLGLAFTVFACPHRLAVDGDVTRVPAFLEKQGSQNIGQSLRVDDAQGFGQRRMTRRRPAYKAEFRLLTPAQAPPKKKGRLHSAPPTQERYDDQAQDRPQHVSLALACRAGPEPAAKSFSTAMPRPPRIRKPLESKYPRPFNLFGPFNRLPCINRLVSAERCREGHAQSAAPNTRGSCLRRLRFPAR